MILKDKLISLPIVKQLVALLKSVRLSKNAFSLYDLLHLYIVGIIKGTVTTRASAISYSFFLAIFPFLLFILNLIPYIPIENFQVDFWSFINDLLPPGTHDFFSNIFFVFEILLKNGLFERVFFAYLLKNTLVF